MPFSEAQAQSLGQIAMGRTHDGTWISDAGDFD